MQSETQQSAFYIADNKALDFLNSIAAPSGTNIEWLSSDLDLASWLLNAKLITNKEYDQYKTKYAGPAEGDIASRARVLREWFRQFIIDHAGKALPTLSMSDVKPINTLLSQDNHFLQIINDSSQMDSEAINSNELQLIKQRRWDSQSDLLLPIAEVMADLICNSDFEFIKNCEGPTCTLWFYDVSKNRSRRWCSMSVCGNRAKAAAHRAKLKQAKTH